MGAETRETDGAAPPERELLYIFYALGMYILVPKRRGTGFLRTPIGHHVSPLSELAHDIGYDLYGLDGMITVECGHVGSDQRAAMADRVVGPISRFLGFPAREVSETEFWDKHPIGVDETRKPIFFK